MRSCSEELSVPPPANHDCSDEREEEVDESVRVIVVERCIECPYHVMLGGAPAVIGCWKAHSAEQLTDAIPEWCPLKKVEVRRG